MNDLPDPISSTFAALADPTRRAILARLRGGDATVTELASPFEMSMPAVSKHLKVLERAGLISRSRDAQWRPCRLKPEPLKEAADWIQQYREMWDARFDRLDAYLQEVQASDQPKEPQPMTPRQKNLLISTGRWAGRVAA